MIAVIQRCSSSCVRIDNEKISEIAYGIMVLLGICIDDKKKDAEYIVKKIQTLRIFNDENGKMNLSINDVKGSILVVSQFTLCANIKKGSRPSFINAAPPLIGKRLYDYFVSYLKDKGGEVHTGEFGADMNVELINQGPATFIIDSEA
ncbi:MAG: D-tyrosyl-tRNA(Tyr) deacylase [Candidatus Marinimicrobia bacterium]|nr:D-tyrosyl-tRNA(Tyr) deacylase [Candidatus Neomarinimicrobiota bacterium]|tara:strand:- start:3151 stop:3594 length:444 start_codon:yes stop_codon:yes gene_type:complete